MQDQFGRDITLVEDEAWSTYSMPGWELVLPARDDAKALDMAAMFERPPAAPDPARLAADGSDAIQNLLDTTANQHGYDSLERCISYIGDANAFWSAEGTRAKAWRSECWTKAKQIQDAATAGKWPTEGAGQLPTVEDVVAAMPAADWPA